MKIITIVLLVCTLGVTVKGDFTYGAGNLQSWNNPTGSDTTPMNLSSPGDLVRIIGIGFGNGGDISRQSIYVQNPTVGNPLWDIYRGQYDSGGPHSFGIISWTDTEIDLEVLRGYGSLLGSFIELRTYGDLNDHSGTTVRGSLTQVPEPSSVTLVLLGICSVFLLYLVNLRRLNLRRSPKVGPLGIALNY